MARTRKGQGKSERAELSRMFIALPPVGTVRTCLPYRDELRRHRVVSADGYDYAVATHRAVGGNDGYITGAYPVQHGYLVLVRQPLWEVRSVDRDAALEEHERLVRVLAEAGAAVVRAKRQLAARRRQECAPADVAPPVMAARLGVESDAGMVAGV